MLVDFPLGREMYPKASHNVNVGGDADGFTMTNSSSCSGYSSLVLIDYVAMTLKG